MHAIDYLLKPFERGRFFEAVEQATAQLNDNEASDIQKRMMSLLEVRTRGRVIFLPVTEIDWVESADNYVRIHSGRGDFLMRDTMSHMEQILDPDRFRRIHRSVIVNVNRIREIEGLAGGEANVLLENGTKLRASRGYRRRLKGLVEPGI